MASVAILTCGCGCGKPVRSKYVRGHHRRLSVQERLEKHVEPEPMSGCWLWTSRVDRDGYGRMTARSSSESLAHRWAFLVYRGPIEPDLTVDHLCRNRRCVNPSHMELVSIRENILRGNGRGAVAARQTECSMGHALNGQRRDANGKRRCRICQKAYDAARYVRLWAMEVGER